MLPLLPRTILHLLNAFIIIEILIILLFPSLVYAKSIYRPSEDTPTFITDASFQETTVSPNVLLRLQQQQQQQEPPQSTDGVTYKDTTAQHKLDLPSRATALSLFISTIQVIWSGTLVIGQFLSFLLLPLQLITKFLFQKFLFLLQPFIVIGTACYTLVILWPIQIVDYLTRTFYPLYVFLAFASIVGLVVGGIASLTTTFLNNTIFPPSAPQPRLKSLPPPKTPESAFESLMSSGTVTPAPARAPPPSKFPSSTAFEDLHILDTNALFSSFSLPIPPATPPGILYSAPTPVGSVSGRVGETIFEEEDDSDEKTPVVHPESWAVGAGRPLIRAASAHGRLSATGGGEMAGGTWHGRVKREDGDAKGIDWGDDEVTRKRRTGVAA